MVNPWKIVFTVPSLVPERVGPGPAEAAALEPAPRASPDGDRKKLATLLADHFVERYARHHGRSIKRISTSAIDMLMTYHWPGNVRELENTLERAVLAGDEDVIHGHHLSPALQTAEASGTVVSGSLAEAVAAFESNLIQDALKSTRGNRTRAARLLGTTERIIGYKIKRYGIDPMRFRGI